MTDPTVRQQIESALKAASVAIDGQDLFVVDWLTVCCFMRTDAGEDGSPKYGYMVLHSDMLPHVQTGLVDYARIYTDGECYDSREDEDE